MGMVKRFSSKVPASWFDRIWWATVLYICCYVVFSIIYGIWREYKHPCLRYEMRMVHYEAYYTPGHGMGTDASGMDFHPARDVRERVCVARKE